MLLPLSYPSVLYTIPLLYPTLPYPSDYNACPHPHPHPFLYTPPNTILLYLIFPSLTIPEYRDICNLTADSESGLNYV